MNKSIKHWIFAVVSASCFASSAFAQIQCSPVTCAGVCVGNNCMQVSEERAIEILSLDGVRSANPKSEKPKPDCHGYCTKYDASTGEEATCRGRPYSHWANVECTNKFQD